MQSPFIGKIVVNMIYLSRKIKLLLNYPYHTGIKYGYNNVSSGPLKRVTSTKNVTVVRNFEMFGRRSNHYLTNPISQRTKNSYFLLRVGTPIIINNIVIRYITPYQSFISIFSVQSA